MDAAPAIKEKHMASVKAAEHAGASLGAAHTALLAFLTSIDGTTEEDNEAKQELRRETLSLLEHIERFRRETPQRLKESASWETLRMGLANLGLGRG